MLPLTLKERKMSRKPFFMRFVETQKATPVRTDVRAGANKPIEKSQNETMKWPSDGDDEPPGGWW